MLNIVKHPRGELTERERQLFNARDAIRFEDEQHHMFWQVYDTRGNEVWYECCLLRPTS